MANRASCCNGLSHEPIVWHTFIFNVNALSLFKSVTEYTNITITTFKEQVIKSLLIKPSVPQPISPGLKHSLIQTKQRRMCKPCYSHLSKNLGRVEAQNKTTKVYSFCNRCKLQMCRDCFIEKHKTTLYSLTVLGLKMSCGGGLPTPMMLNLL